MKALLIPVLAGILVLAILSTGCTNATPPVVEQTPAPATILTTPTTLVTTVPFPNALSLNQRGMFGTGTRTGETTVYRYLAVPNYSWTAPTFNSPHQVEIYNPPYSTQYGYNIEEPAAGNIFLFVYLRVIDTGTTAIYAPSAKQFTVNYDGKTYLYKSLVSSDVVVNGISGKQYDFNFGPGGTVGYVQPGESNAADGYLIYEVLENFIPKKTFVTGNLDFQTQASWRLE